MPRTTLPRLPTLPLLQACERRGVTVNGVAKVHGINARHIYSDAGITWEIADKFAVALGLLPYELWGDEWHAVCEAYEELYPEEEQVRLEQRRARRLETARRLAVDPEPPGRFAGRLLVSARWDPFANEAHACASDGCPEHDTEPMEEVA